MEELIIPLYQALEIQDALRMTINIYNCRKEETCWDRTVMKAKKYIDQVVESRKSIIYTPQAK